MLLYLSFLLPALLISAHALAGVFRDRFPHPVDVATISVAYYGIPLSVAGYFDINFDQQAFLAPFAADHELALFSMRYILVALVSLQLGRVLGKRAGPATFTQFGAASVAAGERVRLAFVGLIGLLGLGILLFGINEFLSGYATDAAEFTGVTGNALVYLTLELMGLSIGYAMIIGQSLDKTPAKTLIAVCVAIFLFVLAIRAKRLEVIAAMLPPLLVFLSRRQSLSSFSWRIVAGSLALAALLVVAIIRVSDNFSAQQAIFLSFSEGLYAGHSMPGILERLETGQLGYEYGSRYISALLGFVPHFLWEGKDNLVYAGNLALEGVSPQGATNMLAEVVLQGSYLAVVISFTIMGLIFERIIRFQNIWDESLARGQIPARAGAYLIAIAIFIPHFRDGIIPAIKLTLQAGVFFVLLSGIWFGTPRRLRARLALTAFPSPSARP